MSEDTDPVAISPGDTHTTTPAFASRIQRTSPSEGPNPITRIRWTIDTANPTEAVGMCFSSGHIDAVRDALNNAQIPVMRVTDDGDDFSIVVSAKRLEAQYPHIFDKTLDDPSLESRGVG